MHSKGFSFWHHSPTTYSPSSRGGDVPPKDARGTAVVDSGAKPQRLRWMNSELTIWLLNGLRTGKSPRLRSFKRYRHVQRCDNSSQSFKPVSTVHFVSIATSATCGSEGVEPRGSVESPGRMGKATGWYRISHPNISQKKPPELGWDIRMGYPKPPGY